MIASLCGNISDVPGSSHRYPSGKSTVHSALYRRFFGIMQELGEEAVMVSQPYVYQRHELAEPDWRRLPGWAGVSEAEWESAVAARPLRQGRAAVAAGHRPGTGRLLLRRPRARPARARHHVHAGAAADAEHHGAHVSTGPPGVHRGFLRRPGAAVHDPGVRRPASRLALSPVRAARLA